MRAFYDSGANTSLISRGLLHLLGEAYNPAPGGLLFKGAAGEVSAFVGLYEDVCLTLHP